MGANQPWGHSTRFIEIGTGPHPVGDWLLQAEFGRYLYVARNDAERSGLSTGHPSVHDHSVVSSDRRVVRNNNAEVLLLGRQAARSTLRFRNVRHASAVVLCGRSGIGQLVAFCACCFHALLGRMTFPRRTQLAGNKSPKVWVFRVKRRRVPTGARHFVPQELGIKGLLQRLHDGQLRHVVLRWFERLPELPAGEDLDLLIDDDQLDTVLEWLSEGPGIQPCDIYSETGLPRSDFYKMPYFPPRLAKEMLDGAVLQNNLCRVPSPKHHLLSLAYHALYHKGPASGIPETSTATTDPRSNADHDYPQILSNLARRQSESLEVTREGLDVFLEANNWRPPRDMLLRLGKRNRWIRQSLHCEPERPEDRGLVTFILRREAMNRGGLDKLVPQLESLGFTILKIKVLANAELRHVASNIRGGNWGRGPWAISGGPPAAVVVAYDPQPLPLTRRQRKKFPLATNARVLEKGHIRSVFNDGLPVEQHCNSLHSSDNGTEAWEYIALAMPESQDEIRRLLSSWRVSNAQAAPVLKDLTRFGRRTRIELIEYHGRLAVRKTFKTGCERFCRREEHAMRELSQRVHQVPPLIESSENSVVYPYYEDILNYERSSGLLIPIKVAQEAITALRQVYDAGYALVDASIDNVLIDRQQGLKLIDFEFLHRYNVRPTSFAESYDIAGCPPDFEDDLPSGGAKNYERNWHPYTGLSLDSLLHDPTWLQHVKRATYVALRPHRYWPRRARYLLRKMVAVCKPRHVEQSRQFVEPMSSDVRRAA